MALLVHYRWAWLRQHALLDLLDLAVAAFDTLIANAVALWQYLSFALSWLCTQVCDTNFYLLMPVELQYNLNFYALTIFIL